MRKNIFHKAIYIALLFLVPVLVSTRHSTIPHGAGSVQMIDTRDTGGDRSARVGAAPQQPADTRGGHGVRTNSTGQYAAVKLIPVLQQVNGDAFVRAGLTGKDVKIGVIDVGFWNADEDSLLVHLFAGNRVGDNKDYIYPAGNQLFGKHSDMDWHGTRVWSFIGGKDRQNLTYGFATDARYFLARTDDGTKEYHKEEEYFREALAWLRSQGVRLVNTSLGYAYGFDNPGENYVPENMDGKTTAITKASEEAVVKYNMIIVTSAGNEGNTPWKIISAPGDGKNVIAVGSTDEHRNKRPFSSEGPDFISYLKPDISCMNHTGGTSFSAPVVTGMVACMLQKNPRLTHAQVKELLEKSGHLYPYGNNYVGYGVPDAERILALMDDPRKQFNRSQEIKATSNEVQLTLEEKEADLVLFHKKDKWVVLRQEKPEAACCSFTVKRPTGAISRSKLVVDDKLQSKFHVEEISEKVTRTTLSTNRRVIEIIWP